MGIPDSISHVLSAPNFTVTACWSSEIFSICRPSTLTILSPDLIPARSAGEPGNTVTIVTSPTDLSLGTINTNGNKMKGIIALTAAPAPITTIRCHRGLLPSEPLTLLLSSPTIRTKPPKGSQLNDQSISAMTKRSVPTDLMRPVTIETPRDASASSPFLRSRTFKATVLSRSSSTVDTVATLPFKDPRSISKTV